MGLFVALLAGAVALTAGFVAPAAESASEVKIERVRYAVTVTYTGYYSRDWQDPDNPNHTQRLETKSRWKAQRPAWLIRSGAGSKRRYQLLLIGRRTLDAPISHSGSGRETLVGVVVGDGVITDCTPEPGMESRPSDDARAKVRLELLRPAGGYTLIVSMFSGATTTTTQEATNCSVQVDGGGTVAFPKPGISYPCKVCLAIPNRAFTWRIPSTKIRFGKSFSLKLTADAIAYPELSKTFPGGTESSLFAWTIAFRPMK